MAIDYLRLTEASLLQLSSLIRARRDLDAEILKLQRRVRSNAAHLSRGNEEITSSAIPSSNTGPLGVTEAVRRVFHYYPMWLSPVSVRDLLPTVGFDFSHYKHPLTSIHSILRRLVATGELIRANRPQVGTAYVWAGCLDDSFNRQTRENPELEPHPHRRTEEHRPEAPRHS